MSAGTHHTDVSAATTNFNPISPTHVHFFNLDDFAGHEIHISRTEARGGGGAATARRGIGSSWFGSLEH